MESHVETTPNIPPLLPSPRKPLIPEFYNSVYEGWATNYLNKHFWKIASQLGDFEDAMSEACVVFYDCRRLYGARVNSQAHFMSLYKRMMWSHFIDWSEYDERQRTALKTYTIKEEVDSDAELNAALNEGSNELKQVMELVLNAPIEVLALLRSDAKSTKRRVDDFFSRAVAMCNLPASSAITLESELRAILE